MKGRFALFFSAALGLLVALGVEGGPGAKPAWAVVIDRIVAVVNKDIVTLSEVQQWGKAEFQRLRKRFSGERLKKEMERVERKYLDLLIMRRLRVQRAKELDLSVSEEDMEEAVEEVKRRNNLNDAELRALLRREGLTMQDYRDRIGEELLIRRVTSVEVRSRVNVTAEEVRAYYESHLSEFMPPERLRAGHILFLAPANGDAEVARLKRARAEAVLARLRAGGEFAELARKYSQDPSAARGGDLGVIRRGEVLPNFERAVFSLKEGEVSGVVRTRAGFHIIKLIERLPRTPKPLREVEEPIRARLFAEKVNARLQRWLEELKKKAYIEVMM